MILDVGGEWVILGHSERRNIFGENDNVIVVHFHSCSVVNYYVVYISLVALILDAFLMHHTFVKASFT